MVKHRNSLPRDVVESPSLERVKSHSEESMADFLSKKVGLDTSNSPFQPQLFCLSLKTTVRMQQKYRKQKGHMFFCLN